MSRTHISFSELKIWNECAFKHRLAYIDEVKKFLGNEYTAFGTAIHHVCEKIVEEEEVDLELLFQKKFLEELKILTEKKVELKQNLIASMRPQGKKIIKYILPAIKETFSEYDVISVEEQLMVPIEEKDYFFKGFIDLVIKTSDGKYHVIDWKSCSWGWDSKKKADRMTTYQLTLYKHFFALKHNIDPKNIETHFALLKRTAKTNNVEIFRVTSGPKKTENALNLLKTALYNITSNRYIKNKTACSKCEFYKTEHCP